jgi:creatinine amidohydrolase
MTREMDKMTTREVTSYLETGPGLVVLPVGSTEQHGPHATLGLDTFGALYVSQRVADKLEALVAPALPYGMSLAHAGFKGTVGLAPTTLAVVVREVCAALLAQGFRLVLIISGHRDNDPSIQIGAAEARAAHGGHVLSMFYGEVNRGRLHEAVGVPSGTFRPEDVRYGADGHGGSVELSLALAFEPGAARPERYFKPDTSRADLRRSLPFRAAQAIDEYADQGVFGNPAGASAERGRHLVEETAAAIAEQVRRYLAAFAKP